MVETPSNGLCEGIEPLYTVNYKRQTIVRDVNFKKIYLDIENIRAKGLSLGTKSFGENIDWGKWIAIWGQTNSEGSYTTGVVTLDSLTVVDEIYVECLW